MALLKASTPTLAACRGGRWRRTRASTSSSSPPWRTVLPHSPTLCGSYSRTAPRCADRRGPLLRGCSTCARAQTQRGRDSKHTDVEPVGLWEAPRNPAHGQEHRPINACPIPLDLYKLEAGLRPPKCPTALTPSVSADSNVPSQARRHARVVKDALHIDKNGTAWTRALKIVDT